MDETQKVSVLIIDDQIVDSLLDSFSRFNKGELRLPEGLPDSSTYVFERMGAAVSIAEAEEQLKEKWDIYIVDRLFPNITNGVKDRREEEDRSLFLLQSLKDLDVTGIRIVYTCHPDPENVIECMRLGAWDYIDKNDHHPVNSAKKVVISALKGLQAKEMLATRARLLAEGSGYVARNYQALEADHKGKFIALTRLGEEKWQMIPGDEATTLFGLYEILGERRMSVHIARIRG